MHHGWRVLMLSAGVLLLLMSCGSTAAVPTPIPMLLQPNDTPAPVRMPIPTDTTAPVAPTIVPIFIDVGADTQVDPAWYPCREGQIKGNTQSKQFYLPATDRYAFTYKTVVCFDTPAAAEAAGFRLAHR